MINKLLSLKTLIFVLLLLFGSLSAAKDLSCDNTRVEYNLGASSIYGYENVNIKVFNNKSELLSEMSYEWVHFSITCFNGKENQQFVVYQAYCGGSGCDDLSNFGIIKADTGKVLLEPYAGNRSVAKEILKELPKEL